MDTTLEDENVIFLDAIDLKSSRAPESFVLELRAQYAAGSKMHPTTEMSCFISCSVLNTLFVIGDSSILTSTCDCTICLRPLYIYIYMYK